MTTGHKLRVGSGALENGARTACFRRSFGSVPAPAGIYPTWVPTVSSHPTIPPHYNRPALSDGLRIANCGLRIFGRVNDWWSVVRGQCSVVKELTPAWWAHCFPSPRPNGFPSPPQDCFPTRDVRFAHRGPQGRGGKDGRFGILSDALGGWPLSVVSGQWSVDGKALHSEPCKHCFPSPRPSPLGRGGKDGRFGNLSDDFGGSQLSVVLKNTELQTLNTD
jgi:hypothetical protein